MHQSVNRQHKGNAFDFKQFFFSLKMNSHLFFLDKKAQRILEQREQYGQADAAANEQAGAHTRRRVAPTRLQTQSKQAIA